MIRCVIVEDELNSREALKAMLKRFCPDVLLCGEAEGVESGKEIIDLHHPDLVFLDIEMRDGSGFRLLEKFGNIDFEVVFTTAFEQFALKAIRYQVLDYLLKPIVPDELIAAVEKVKEIKEKKNSLKNIENLIHNYQSNAPEKRKLSLATTEKIHIVDVGTIIRCESDNYYTHFYFTDGKHLLISKTLKEIEAMLEEDEFIRPHKSHLINIKFIQNFNRSDVSSLTLTDGTQIPVSRRKKDKVLEIIQNM
jgi:two-component system LytT family response regulator